MKRSKSNNKISVTTFSFFDKNLMFNGFIIHKNCHLWSQDVDTNFQRILTFSISCEECLSCALDGLGGSPGSNEYKDNICQHMAGYCHTPQLEERRNKE